jgi:hypothetical protein
MQAISIVNTWISCKCSRVWVEKATVRTMHQQNAFSAALSMKA